MIFETRQTLLPSGNVLHDNRITSEVISNLSSKFREKILIAAQDTSFGSELNIKKLVVKNHQRFFDLHCRNNCASRQRFEDDFCKNLLPRHFNDVLNYSLFRFEKMASGRNQPAKASGGDGRLHSAAKNSHLYQNSLPIAKKQPRCHGHELVASVSRIELLVTVKMPHLEWMMHVKFIEAQNPLIGMMWKPAHVSSS
ncbi:uncharacterized protein TNCV_4676751 [Trichonephila clavipes]|nr:uncharacterized protein TNCV_4676751 [Trichonephila clavipes]